MSLFLSFSQLFPAIFKMKENAFMQSAIKVFLGFFDMGHTHLPKEELLIYVCGINELISFRSRDC